MKHWVAYLFGGACLFAAPCAATDPDTLCATVYVFLAEEAARSGVSNAGFNASANAAEDNYLAEHPGEDSQRYTVSIIDGAQNMREALLRGAITVNWVVQTDQQCDLRYGAR